MGVGAGLYMYVVVAQKFTFAISSPDKFLWSLWNKWKSNLTWGRIAAARNGSVIFARWCQFGFLFLPVLPPADMRYIGTVCLKTADVIKSYSVVQEYIIFVVATSAPTEDTTSELITFDVSEQPALVSDLTDINWSVISLCSVALSLFTSTSHSSVNFSRQRRSFVLHL